MSSAAASGAAAEATSAAAAAEAGGKKLEVTAAAGAGLVGETGSGFTRIRAARSAKVMESSAEAAAAEEEEEEAEGAEEASVADSSLSRFEAASASSAAGSAFTAGCCAALRLAPRRAVVESASSAGISSDASALVWMRLDLRSPFTALGFFSGLTVVGVASSAVGVGSAAASGSALPFFLASFFSFSFCLRLCSRRKPLAEGHKSRAYFTPQTMSCKLIAAGKEG